jgi:hypothetical protein
MHKKLSNANDYHLYINFSAAQRKFLEKQQLEFSYKIFFESNRKKEYNKILI